MDCKCTKCGHDTFTAESKGDYAKVKLEKLGSRIGKYGDLVLQCEECGIMFEIALGSD